MNKFSLLNKALLNYDENDRSLQLCEAFKPVHNFCFLQ